MKRFLAAIVTFIFGVCLLFSVAATASAASVKKVSNFKATATHITATLTWKKTSGATGYEIQRKDGKKWKTVTTIKKASTTSYTVKKLKNDKTYEFRIRAVKGKKKGKYVTVKVKTSVPKITSFKASVSGPTTAKFTWKKANVTGYEIQVKSGKKWKSVTKIKKAKTTSATVKNVPVNATTTYRIRGYITGTGKTYYGAYTELKVKTSIPKITSFKASVSGPSTAKFTWAKKANVTGYEIQLKSGKEWKTVKKITKAATTSVTLKDVIPNATSSYRIRGYVTASGKTYYGSASSEVKVTTSIPKISSFKASVSGSSTAKFTWAKANVTGYEIQLKSGSSWKTVSTVKDAATVSVTLKNVTPNATSSYRIRGYVTVSGKNYYGSASSEVSVKTSVPAVSSFKASVSGLTTAKFTWAKANVTGYEIQIKSGDSWKTVSTVKDAATVSVTLTNVPADTTSSYRIRGYVTVSGKNYYGTASAVDVKTAVKSMGTVSVSSVTSNSATITWSKVSDVSGYQVQKYEGGKWVDVNSKISASTTSCTVTGLSALTSYQIRIRAYQTVSKSTYYNSWKTVSAKTKIGTSSNLKVSSISTTSAKLTWTAAGGATAYRILNNGTEIANVKTNSATLSSLKAGTTYKITVVPYAGSTVASATSAVTFTTPCAKVTGVKVTTTETTASVSWSKATGATSYQLQYRKSGGDWSSNIAVSGTSYSLSDLPLNTAYDFRVRALNKNGSTTQYGEYSSIVSDTTYGFIYDSGKLSWRAISGAKNYQIQYYDIDTRSWNIAADGLTETSYSDETLFADSSRLFKLIAFDSNEKAIYTKMESQKVTDFDFSMSNNVLSVFWSEYADASKYEVVILSEGMDADGKSVITVKAADRKLTRNLAPGLKYDVKVLAVKGSTDSVIAHFTVKTTDLVIKDTDESKTAQLLYLVEAINRSKFDNSKRTILKVTPYNLNEVSYMDFGFVFDDFWAPIKRGLANTLLNTLFGSAMSDKGLKKKSLINNKNYDYDVDKGFIKCYTADAIDTLFASMEDGGKAEKVSKTETGGRMITYNFNEGKYYGGADYKLADLIQPTGNVDGLAYLYNSNNVSAWKNGFSSVTTTKTETGYRVEATLKKETTPNYHSGFIATSVSGDFGLGDMGKTNINSTAGETVITAEIDEDCRLTSYNVSSPYKYDMNVNLSINSEDADVGDNEEMGALVEGLSKIVMEMNVKAEGKQEYKYSFIRTK